MTEIKISVEAEVRVKAEIITERDIKHRSKKLTKDEREAKLAKERKTFFFARMAALKQLKEIKAMSRATFTDRQMQAFREELEMQRSILAKERRCLSKELSTELCLELERSRSGNHHADINVEDSIVTQSLVCNRQKRLGKIDEALKRIDNGTYGICLECFQPIATGRLLSTPIADLCEQCKEDKEQKESGRLNGINHRYRRSDQLHYAST